MVQITKNKIAEYFKKYTYYMEKYNTPRKFENAVNKQYDSFMATYNKPLVKRIELNIEWSRNGNPTGSFLVTYVNGKTIRGTHPRIGGGGFDKRLEMMESILNSVAKQNLYHKRLVASTGYDFSNSGYRYQPDTELLPRYVLGHPEGKYKYFTIEHVAWGQTYDRYVITFKN